jgi:hypothetical protein
MTRLMQLAVAACALTVGLTSAVEAQFSSARPVRSSRPEPRFEVAVFGGYQFGGNWDAVVGGTPGRLDVADHGNYGMSFAVRARPGVLGEFLYLRQPSTLFFQPVNGIKEEVFPVQVAYYQLGGMYEMARGRLRPFGSLSAGATHFNPKESGFGSEWRFSVAAGLGVRAFITERNWRVRNDRGIGRRAGPGVGWASGRVVMRAAGRTGSARRGARREISHHQGRNWIAVRGCNAL